MEENKAENTGNNPDTSVKIQVNSKVDTIIEEITNEGIESYFKKLKNETPPQVSRDFIVKNLNYSVKVTKKSENQDVSNFVKDFFSIISTPFRKASITKEILKNINLDLKSGTTTIV